MENKLIENRNPNVTYDKFGRWYEFKDTPKLPSVTTILKFGEDQSFLEAWKKRVGEKEAARISKRATNRGEVMHKMVENYFLYQTGDKLIDYNNVFTKTDWNEFQTFDTEHIDNGKYLFDVMYKSNIFNQVKRVIGLETPLHYWNGKVGYAGRTDLIFESIFDDIVICDLKSSTKTKRSEWIEKYYKQASAYCYAYYQMYKVYPSARIWIATECGKLQEFKMKKTDIRYFFSRFISDVFSFYNNKKNK